MTTDQDFVDGWYSAARRVESPNFDQRADASETQDDISLLVIHNISLPPGEFGGGFVQKFFTNCLDKTLHPFFEEIKDLKVSAHFFIERSGAITQFVSCDHRAWHAGQSCFEGRDRCNDFSIGIELEGCDDVPYEPEQYESLASLTQKIRKHYSGIRSENIVGHSDIAPGRKTDPGTAFDWEKYRRSI